MDHDKIMQRFMGGAAPFEKSDQDGSPLYFQLAKSIQKQIESGRLKTGDLVPSERKVAAFNNLSVATVRKAYEELSKKGFLIRVHGKGTFVASTADRRKTIRYYPFVENYYDAQKGTNVKLISLEAVPGLPEINRQLQLKPDQELLELKRVLSMGDNPTVYCVSYLPRHMFRGLEDYDREHLESYAVYLFFEEKFGITTIEHIELFSAVPAEGEAAKWLEVEPGHPLLSIDKLVFTLKKKPYEVRRSYCRTGDLKLRRIM